MDEFVTKKNLVEKGYCENQAKMIIKMAKESLVQEGYVLYNNKKLSMIPREAVEKIIGIGLAEA